MESLIKKIERRIYFNCREVNDLPNVESSRLRKKIDYLKELDKKGVELVTDIERIEWHLESPDYNVELERILREDNLYFTIYDFNKAVYHRKKSLDVSNSTK